MINEPLSSSQQSKIFIFILLLIPSVLFIVGILPVIFLILGVWQMKRNKDFSYIETAVGITKWYLILILTGLFLGILVSEYFRLIDTTGYNYETGDLTRPIISSFIATALAYLFLLYFLFLNPLKSHCKWIEVNGMFSSKFKAVAPLEGIKQKRYSAADELLKWAKLKEHGLISEQEYLRVRKKLV